MAARRIENLRSTSKISTARFLSILLSFCAILPLLGCSSGGAGGGGEIRPSAGVTTEISNKASLPDFTAGNPAILCSSYTVQGTCTGAGGEQINAYKWVLRKYPEEARTFLKNLYGDTSPGSDEIIVEQGTVSPQNEINLSLDFEPRWPAPFNEAPLYSLGLAGSTTGGEEYSDIPLEGQWIFKTEPLRIDSVTHASARDGGPVTVNGAGFADTVVLQVGIYGPVTLASVDCNTIQFTVPTGNYCGSYTVTVYNSGDVPSHAVTGTLVFDPVIIDMSHASACEGGPVTIYGFGFDASVVLQVGGSYGPVTLAPVDCNTIQFTMPAGSHCVSDPVTVYNLADSSNTATGTLIYDPVI